MSDYTSPIDRYFEKNPDRFAPFLAAIITGMFAVMVGGFFLAVNAFTEYQVGWSMWALLVLAELVMARRYWRKGAEFSEKETSD